MAVGVDVAEDVSLDGLIRLAFDHLMTDVRVSLPGKIESFDKDTRLATIQPMIQRRYLGDSEPTNLPVVQMVPLVEMRTQNAILSLPVASGDPVLLVFSDRAMDNWLGGNGSQPADPEDVRQHDITDAFAILGGWPELMTPSHPGPSGDDAEFLVAPGVKIGIGNGTDELISILHEFVEYVEQTITFSNGGGPTGPPKNALVLTEIKTRLENLKV